MMCMSVLRLLIRFLSHDVYAYDIVRMCWSCLRMCSDVTVECCAGLGIKNVTCVCTGQQFGRDGVRHDAQSCILILFV